MELIKDNKLEGSRKLLTHSEATGYSAFFSDNHDGVVVGKLKEVTCKGKTSTRVDKASYHKDVRRALVKLAEIEAEAGFTEGSLGSYIKMYDKSLEGFLSEVAQNNK